MIILNKIELVKSEDLEKVVAVVKKLNPTVKLFQTNYSDVPLKGNSRGRNREEVEEDRREQDTDGREVRDKRIGR